jgi:hypothetical protein
LAGLRARDERCAGRRPEVRGGGREAVGSRGDGSEPAAAESDAAASSTGVALGASHVGVAIVVARRAICAIVVVPVRRRGCSAC